MKIKKFLPALYVKKYSIVNTNFKDIKPNIQETNPLSVPFVTKDSHKTQT